MHGLPFDRPDKKYIRNIYIYKKKENRVKSLAVAAPIKASIFLWHFNRTRESSSVRKDCSGYENRN